MFSLQRMLTDCFFCSAPFNHATACGIRLLLYRGAELEGPGGWQRVLALPLSCATSLLISNDRRRTFGQLLGAVATSTF